MITEQEFDRQLEKLSEQDRELVNEAFNDAEDALIMAVERMEELAATAKDAGMKSLAARMDAYIVPHLRTWLGDDRYQISSLPDIRDDIDQYFEGRG